MIKLDLTLLPELGLADLPPEEARVLLKHMYDTLEMRVGTAMASLMTKGQLDEFAQLMDLGDEKTAFAWLESNFPDYKEIVGAAFADLKEEVRASAPAILENVVDEGRPDATSRDTKPAPDNRTVGE